MFTRVRITFIDLNGFVVALTRVRFTHYMFNFGGLGMPAMRYYMVMALPHVRDTHHRTFFWASLLLLFAICALYFVNTFPQ